MNKWKRTTIIIIFLEVLFLIPGNFLYWKNLDNKGERLYRVEAERVAERLRDSGGKEMDLSEFPTIVRVHEFHNGTCNNDSMVKEVNGTLYCIDYERQQNIRPLLYLNGILLAVIVLTFLSLWYIRKKVLLPFEKMQNLPAELAKGNLAVPIPEERSKFFGKFLWGMDLLRENMEEKRQREWEWQKERKTLILSLSHDIKTPLSAIELYTKALSEDLYDTEEKRNEVYDGISKNIREIKNYVNEITRASREDFLKLEVKEEEFYLSEVVSFIQTYYTDKLSVLHTEFVVEEAENCLVQGDKDRLIEVLQNIMENAVKYGDGKKISLSFREEEDCQLIEVKNTGASLEKEELPHLFDSFYRGSNSKKERGSGLGLYICRELMRKMDGDIFIHMEEDIFCVTAVIPKAG